MLIIPGRFNVIAKAQIKRGVGIGMKGWWEETTLETIRANNRLIGQLSDQEIQDMIAKYTPFMVTWNTIHVITFHPADDDRLLFTPKEE